MTDCPALERRLELIEEVLDAYFAWAYSYERGGEAEEGPTHMDLVVIVTTIHILVQRRDKGEVHEDLAKSVQRDADICRTKAAGNDLEWEETEA